MVVNRLSQQIANDVDERPLYAVGPRYDSYMYRRFADWFEKYSPNGVSIYPRKQIEDLPQNKRHVKVYDSVNPDLFYEGPMDPFLNNQVPMKDYYENLAQNELYRGMFEAIGRVTIYAAQYLNNPFAKFIKPPLYHGNAHMAGLFKPITSHDWWPGKPNDSKKFGIKNILGVNVPEGQPLAGGASQLYEAPDTGWLFKAERPEFVSTVSRVNFSREIAIKINARDYARYCQTPEMVGEIGAALMGQSHAIYMNDMREASKYFFCGVLRAGKELKTNVEYGTEFLLDNVYANPWLPDDPMIAQVVIHHDDPNVGFNLEKVGDQIADGVTRLIHNTVEVDFAEFSNKYNPEGLDRFVENCTVVLDKHVRYDVFKKYYAELHHPEFIRPGPKTEFTWIHSFPKIASAVFPTAQYPHVEGGKKHWYELICMIVDDNAMAIIPYYQPVTVQTFYNAHLEDISFFTHYQCDFEFKPFFNRKYIYLHHIANEDDPIPPDIQPNDIPNVMSGQKPLANDEKKPKAK